ncbi:uncharacterized protein LOC112693429 [Sipha flava]|uniref:Uncharacterized protein LOC112693429 n=1 Tax=Sipha flava TaxID=143950 RepID=A0A2S2QG85_9HEMI|nr:uncharacterized protein LOC112693429 [Sipha flava]XP_025424280.1 uncharacterized protein LOC112693429 [Sipha flava]
MAHRTGPIANINHRYRRSGSSGSENDEEMEEEEEEEDDSGSSCSSCSTLEADEFGDAEPVTWQRRRRQRSAGSGDTATAAAATAFELLDARRLSDLLDPARLVTVLDACLGSEYVRGCVVETWDEVLSDHLDAIAHLVLYQTPEHAVSQAVYEQLTELSAMLRPYRPVAAAADVGDQIQRPTAARVDANRVYGTLRSAARSLLSTRVDACCRQSMCRAVGLAVAALRANTRPVFSVENFLVEINEAANFANLYCTGYAKRICAVLKDIYDAVMAGEYHPTNVLIQMAVMEKSIGAALQTLADARATAAQKTAAQRSLLAELDGVCATVRMKNHGCLDDGAAAAGHRDAAAALQPVAGMSRGRHVHFTMSPWRAPIRMYHQQSPVSVDQVLRTTVRLVEALVAEMFKPCLNNRQRARRRRPRAGQLTHEKQL